MDHTGQLIEKINELNFGLPKYISEGQTELRRDEPKYIFGVLDNQRIESLNH